MAGYRRTLSTALPQRCTRPWGLSPHPYPKLGLQQHDTRQQQRPSAGWVTLRLLLRLVVTGGGVAVLTGTLLHCYRPATGNAVIFSCLPC